MSDTLDRAQTYIQWAFLLISLAAALWTHSGRISKLEQWVADHEIFARDESRRIDNLEKALKDRALNVPRGHVVP